jgi:SAM-dependent methyltransferase
MKSEIKVKIARMWNYPSEIGDRYNISWLTYNPGVFFEFAMVAKRNAPLFCSALKIVFPDALEFNDIGCGTGQFVKQLRLNGLSCEGYEYSKLARLFSFVNGVKLKSFDLSTDPPIKNLKKVDLTYSLEVGEHIPELFSSKFVNVLTNAGKIVVFTAAQPGQKGHGHINCKPLIYWENIFINEGYIKSIEHESLMKKELMKLPKISKFLIDNLQVFVESDNKK